MNEYVAFAQAHPLLVFGFLGLLGYVLWLEFGRFTRKYKQVSAAEAVQILNKDHALCLDVREDKEMGEGYINGARHIPMAQLVKRVGELDSYKSSPVLVYCRSGSRSGFACNLLTKNGFENVSNLSGGILAWESAKLPLSKR